MKRFFEEYGAVILSTISAIIIIAVLLGVGKNLQTGTGSIFNKFVDNNKDVENTVVYKVEYNSSTGKKLSVSSVSGVLGSSKEVKPVRRDGYIAPSPQTVTWDTDKKVITFIYTPIEYKINYDLGGGRHTNPPTYNIESPDIVLKAPTKEGSNFTGWTGDGLSKPELEVTIPAGSTGDKNYKANWALLSYKYNVVYESASGKLLGTNNINGQYGSTEQIVAPEKTGYVTPQPQNVRFDTTSSKTIKFIYTPIEYNITYNLDGGTLNNQIKTYNVETPDFTLPRPTKIGFNFKGWTGTGLAKPELDVTIPTGSTGDKSFTAFWGKNSYVLTFDSNGGNPISPNTSTFEYGEQFGLLPTARRTDYVFVGWFTEPIGGKKITETSTMPAQNTTIYAHWDQYNIYGYREANSFDPNVSFTQPPACGYYSLNKQYQLTYENIEPINMNGRIGNLNTTNSNYCVNHPDEGGCTNYEFNSMHGAETINIPDGVHEVAFYYNSARNRNFDFAIYLAGKQVVPRTSSSTVTKGAWNYFKIKETPVTNGIMTIYIWDGNHAGVMAKGYVSNWDGYVTKKTPWQSSPTEVPQGTKLVGIAATREVYSRANGFGKVVQTPGPVEKTATRMPMYSKDGGITWKEYPNDSYCPIPSQYTQLEYLEANGTQYINTNYYPTANTRLDTKFRLNSTKLQQRVFGIFADNTNPTDALIYDWYINKYTNFAFDRSNRYGAWQDTGIKANTSDHTLEFNRNGNVIFDGRTIAINHSASNKSPKPLPLFAAYYYDTNRVEFNMSGRIYYVNIYEGDKLVRKLAPVSRKSDGVAGFYDVIENKFYTNAGSGTFTKGPSIHI